MRATKKEIAARSKLLCKIVRENPGLTAPQIAEISKMNTEKMRPTLMALLLVRTKRGFKMYREGRRFYTTKNYTSSPPDKEMRKEMRKGNLKAFDFDKSDTAIVFDATPQELESAKSLVASDVQKHQEAQKSLHRQGVRGAQQNDDHQLERWLAPLVRNHQTAKTRLHQATTAIDALYNLGETMTTELHTLREAVLDFIEGGVTINALRQMVGERPKKEGEQ